MNRHFLTAFIAVFTALAMPATATAQEPVDYVNTLMGTQSSHSLSTGNTYPAVAMPWGMNCWTPQTGRAGDGWAYTYDAEVIRGIKQTHQPSPWINDYGQFTLMPVTGQPVADQDRRASHFSHKAETSTPYYYKVYLADHNATLELAPTSRAAVMRTTYHDGRAAYMVIESGQRLQVDADARTVTGRSTRNSGGVPTGFANYFVIVFSHDLTSVQVDDEAAVVGFDTRAGEQVTAYIASSFISHEQAWRNMAELAANADNIQPLAANAQPPAANFRTLEQIADDGRRQWNDALARITVESDSHDRLRTFYSCLYRALLFPRAFYEHGADGRPIHYSPYDGRVHDGYMFTDTGFWDTFRALFPLLNLVYPSVSAQIQQGLANAYLESGFLPEWTSPGHRDCMVGNNSASVVADAYLKGIRPTMSITADDGTTAEVSCADILWEAVTHGANASHPTVSSTGRLGYELYNRLGYVPCDAGINESAARTLEYAYDDWCILQYGRALGRGDAELAPYARHALNYRNLFDPDHRLMRGRQTDGRFQSPYNPFKWGDAFTEGNAWHYTWSVFHDPAGLASLMGGSESMAAMLDSVFALPPTFDESYYGFVIHEIREMQIMGMGNYAHGNQPIQHMIYLYDWTHEPWKAQYWTREVIDRLYTPTPDGYCGDEDNGQTSAWYVFSALGFYPVCPGSGEYALGAPVFPRATITLENGRRVVINAPAVSSARRYIDRLRIDGADSQRNYVTHRQLTDGAVLDFDMSDRPNLTRGTAPADLPYSFSTPAGN